MCPPAIAISSPHDVHLYIPGCGAGCPGETARSNAASAECCSMFVYLYSATLASSRRTLPM